MVLTRDLIQLKYPGRNREIFNIFLDKPLEPKDTITYDIDFGQLLEVIESKITNNTDFETKVRLKDEDEEVWLLPSQLKKETEYFLLK